MALVGLHLALVTSTLGMRADARSGAPHASSTPVVLLAARELPAPAFNVSKLLSAKVVQKWSGSAADGAAATAIGTACGYLVGKTLRVTVSSAVCARRPAYPFVRLCGLLLFRSPCFTSFAI